MAMEMRLSQKLVTKLVMTPMLQQAIKLLPLARMELAQLVRQEITENPILDRITSYNVCYTKLLRPALHHGPHHRPGVWLDQPK